MRAGISIQVGLRSPRNLPSTANDKAQFPGIAVKNNGKKRLQEAYQDIVEDRRMNVVIDELCTAKAKAEDEMSAIDPMISPRKARATVISSVLI